MIQSILSNIAIILLGHLLMGMLRTQRKLLSNAFMSIGIVLLFSAVIISMFYLPIRIDGYNFDLRLIPLIFLAIFHGWKMTIPTLIIVCMWRYFMGGVGMMPGILAGMIGPTLFVLLYYTIKKDLHNIYEKIWIITVCWFISDFPIVFIIPNGWEVFKGFFLIRYSSFLIVAFIYYFFIKSEYNREYYKVQLERMAWYDQLTNLLNRRKFIELIESKQMNDTHHQFIALIDLDYFKQVNDTYGHLAGDNVLIQLASIFKEQQSDSMLIARYGGEEFIVYLEADSLEDAINTMENLRNHIKNTSFEIVTGHYVPITISIGLAPLEKSVPLKDTISLADRYLYIAKENGRDQLISTPVLVEENGCVSEKINSNV